MLLELHLVIGGMCGIILIPLMASTGAVLLPLVVVAIFAAIFMMNDQ